MDTKPLYHKPHSLIISDLHLSEKSPEATALFMDFISQKAMKADSLYILGDLFEFWIGDDDLTPYHQSIIDKLKQLTQSGVQLFLIQGNRDFLLGQRFLNMVGATELPQASVLNFYGKSVLLMHGDSLCTDDVKYQRYRKIVNWRWLQNLFLALPLRFRRRIALKIRQHSRGQREYQDVNAQAVMTTMSLYQVNYLIHGHTHRFALHYTKDNNIRMVLSDWHNDGSYIEIDEQKMSLNYLSPSLFPFPSLGEEHLKESL